MYLIVVMVVNGGVLEGVLCADGWFSRMGCALESTHLACAIRGSDGPIQRDGEHSFIVMSYFGSGFLHQNTIDITLIGKAHPTFSFDFDICRSVIHQKRQLVAMLLHQ